MTAARVSGSNSPQIATASPIESGTTTVPTANAMGVAVARKRGRPFGVGFERPGQACARAENQITAPNRLVAVSVPPYR